MKLYYCKTEADQAAWVVEHLKKGGRVHDIGLWLGGVDRPMRVIALTKQRLHAQGRTVTKAMETVQDAAGEKHRVLAWRLTEELPDTAP
jgi:hypothetical protein